MIEWIENAGSSFGKSKTREITSKIGKWINKCFHSNF
jgi:hypothetical protein